MSRIFLRGTSSVLATAFVMLLMAGAWRHCWPDPYAALFKKQAHTELPSKIRGPHHVCAALKDSYDGLLAMQVYRSGSFESRAETLQLGKGVAIKNNSLLLHDLSPPFRRSARFILPIFNLNSNLRL